MLATQLNRVGFANNVALGFMAFTLLLLFAVRVVMVSVGITPDVLSARMPK